MGTFAKVVGAVVIGALVALGMLIVWPLLVFFLGALSGWVIVTFLPFLANWLVAGLALVGLHVEAASLPLLVGTLAFFGSYFGKTAFNNKSK